MIFQSLLDESSVEVAFRVVKSSLTATLTSTDRLSAGEPVVLATHTASNNGIYIARPGNLDAAVNNLYIGNVHETIEHEAVGLVQCYGYDSDANVGDNTDTAITPGRIVRPGTNRSLQLGDLFFATSASAGTGGTDQADVARSGVAGLAIVVAQPTATIATVTIVGGVDTPVFIRAL